MSKLIMNPEFQLYEQDGKAFCSSRQLAEKFEKQHNHILRDIEFLSSNLSKLGQIESSEPTPGLDDVNVKFTTSMYKDSRGRKQKEVLMTKDAFALLAMGFDGQKALSFKITFLSRFNAMEQFIASLQSAKNEFPEFTEAINLAHDEPKSYYFSNELNMINKIVLGMNAKQFKALHNLNEVTSIRPYLTSDQITLIERLQKFDIGLIYTEPDFQRRKSILTDYNQRISTRLLKISIGGGM